MNRDEAKFVLRAYHLGGQDAEDPQFRDALELTKRDPALAEWFAREQELDASLSEKFRAFPIPHDLKGQLLAARKVIPFPAWKQRRVWIVAVAACVALLLGLTLAFLRPSEKSQLVEFRSFAADATSKLDHLDLMTKDVAEAKQWLEKQLAPSDFAIPPSLDERPSIGCRVFEWKGQRVSLVCFRIDGGHEAHLFVMNRPRNPPRGEHPEFATLNGITTASWGNSQRLYVLATDQGEAELRRLLL